MSKVNSHWNYAFGLQQNEKIGEQVEFYNYSMVLQSNGFTNAQFSNNGNGKEGVSPFWRPNDVLIMKRDDYGNLLFGINNENDLKQGFSSVVGSYRLIMGFRNKTNGDVFELIELIKSP